MTVMQYVIEVEDEIKHIFRLFKDGFIEKEDVINKLADEVLRLEQLIQE